LIDRLNKDASIAPLVAQFVPLKIDTDGANWGQWAQKYPHQGNAIPILYVVRADGELLYGKSGSKPGAELPAFLTQQLTTAGTIFSPEQLTAIQKAVDETNRALSESDDAGAVNRLESLRRIGDVGRFGSYATAALEADKLHGQLVERGKAALDAAKQKLEADDPFAGVLGVLAANRIYQKLPELKKELGTAERDLGRKPELKDVVRQAEALDKALSLLNQRQGKKLALTALEKVVSRFPDTPAAEQARAKLEELGASPPESSTEAKPASGLRMWSDRSGKFKVEAELVGVADGKVQLKRKDGQTVEVPLERLSDEDQKFIADP
jgi:tetratricopeptide (TPR) repeat protein